MCPLCWAWRAGQEAPACVVLHSHGRHSEGSGTSLLSGGIVRAIVGAQGPSAEISGAGTCPDGTARVATAGGAQQVGALRKALRLPGTVSGAERDAEAVGIRGQGPQDLWDPVGQGKDHRPPKCPGAEHPWTMTALHAHGPWEQRGQPLPAPHGFSHPSEQCPLHT